MQTLWKTAFIGATQVSEMFKGPSLAYYVKFKMTFGNLGLNQTWICNN